MFRRFAAPLLVVCILLLAGCAASTSPPAAAVGPPANVAGQWSGSAGVGATSAPVTMSLDQNGAAVTGTILVAGRSDLSGPIVGTVRGNTLLLDLRNGYGSLPNLTALEDRITGVLSVGPMMLQRAR